MKKFIFTMLMIYLSTYALSISQEEILSYIGKQPVLYKTKFSIEAGLNYNLYSSTTEWQHDVEQSIYNVFNNASGISPYFAVAVDIPMDQITNKYGIQAKVAYNMRSYSNSYSGKHNCQYFNGYIFIVSDGALMDAELDTKSADLSISAILRYNITREIIVTFGPTIAIPVGDFEQKMLKTYKSDDCYFYDENLNTSKQLETKSTLSDVKTRFGLDLGLGYSITMSKAIVITPQVSFNYFFSKYRDDETILDDTRASFYPQSELTLKNNVLNSLKFGLALWF